MRKKYQKTLDKYKTFWYNDFTVRRKKTETKFGVSSGEGPPVPIPNTEVKLAIAENT